MELIVLGAGPAYSDRPGAIGAAYLVRHGDDAVVLDLGHGTFSALAGAIEPSRLRAVSISHLHPDHFIDLVALRHYLRYQFTPPRPVRVLGPADLLARIDALHAEPGFAAETLDHEPYDRGSTRAVGRFTVEAALVTHTDESYGVRVSIGDGPGIVYSGDCARADDLAPLLRPGDTLLTECSFGPGPVTRGAQHLDGPAVGALAARTNPGRVLLTHIQMGWDRDATVAAVRDRYDGPVAAVSPGDGFSL